ncbi:hypothetical protein CDD81_7894 [Ophiocordyceps australis]|uniref:laccase n=1 Tax=Ophiocordyceps australis TaxID=1399860 RepID=A0A2C5YHC4_9HYPO|nr:hypothetical protein CDD81_7894 [Ophiocordyceps australis]
MIKTGLFAALVLVPLQAAWAAKPYPQPPCAGNTPTTRSKWCQYSVDTDYTTVVPDTGRTREYWLELTDVTIAPDGVPRTAMAINGSIPGPTIFADWGDHVVVHVKNSLTRSHNGTTIHWHGIRQNYTNQNDGVAAITQCPTKPGDSITYKWRAVQYGSTWYHSHFALQAWEGIFGGLIINGPATQNYDEDLGTITLNDWDAQTVDQLYTAAQTLGPPELANVLINGTNVYGNGGKRLNINFKAGKSYRMRFINVGIDSHFKVMIDNHTMSVIGADLNPIKPYQTNMIDIGIGQRYDVVVKANQAAVAKSFWLRVIPQVACSKITNGNNVRAIVHYGNDKTTPNTTGYSYVDSCGDETPRVVPHVPKNVGRADQQTSEAVALATINGLFKWTLNSTTFLVDWKDPTLRQITTNSTVFTKSNAVIELPEPNKMFYLVIDTALAVTHPIHLHGHDFYVLAQGVGTYSPSSVMLNTTNPPRRDTAMLPAKGYLVLAFESDNPGAWLMHCHIGWHTSEGFALQFVERRKEIPAIIDKPKLLDQCKAWSNYQDSLSILQEDSGV